MNIFSSPLRAFFILGVFLGMFWNCNHQDKTSEAEVIELITAEEMQTIIELEDVQLIDVRTEKEYNSDHIIAAQNINFLSPTFEEDIKKLDKSKPVIVYCEKGGRSAQCAQKLKEAGFEKIYDLEGGLSKWRHSKHIKTTHKFKS